MNGLGEFPCKCHSKAGGGIWFHCCWNFVHEDASPWSETGLQKLQICILLLPVFVRFWQKWKSKIWQNCIGIVMAKAYQLPQRQRDWWSQVMEHYEKVSRDLGLILGSLLTLCWILSSFLNTCVSSLSFMGLFLWTDFSLVHGWTYSCFFISLVIFY